MKKNSQEHYQACMTWREGILKKQPTPVGLKNKNKPGYLLWDIVFKGYEQHPVGQVYAKTPYMALDTYVSRVSNWMALTTKLLKLQSVSPLVVVKPKQYINQLASEAVQIRREIAKLNRRLDDINDKIHAYD